MHIIGNLFNLPLTSFSLSFLFTPLLSSHFLLSLSSFLWLPLSPSPLPILYFPHSPSPLSPPFNPYLLSTFSSSSSLFPLHSSLLHPMCSHNTNDKPSCMNSYHQKHASIPQVTADYKHALEFAIVSSIPFLLLLFPQILSSLPLLAYFLLP